MISLTVTGVGKVCGYGWESFLSLFASAFLMTGNTGEPLKGKGDKSWDSREHMKYFSEVEIIQ